MWLTELASSLKGYQTVPGEGKEVVGAQGLS